MEVMLEKIAQSLETHNITFDPKNQRIRCLAHVINLAAKKLINSICADGGYEDERTFEAAEDSDENLKDTIYKVTNITSK